MELQLAQKGIVDDSIVDGPGIRLVVFTQGCPHHCPGCHNPQTHAFRGGVTAHTAEIEERFAQNPLLAGITFSGGEPFLQPEPLCELARFVRRRRKTVVTYTGFTYEELLDKTLLAPDRHAIRELLALTDLLIDGPFVLSRKDLTLPFRGSRNQRLLDREDRERLARQGMRGVRRSDAR